MNFALQCTGQQALEVSIGHVVEPVSLHAGGHRRFLGRVGFRLPTLTREPSITDEMRNLRQLMEKTPNADLLRETIHMRSPFYRTLDAQNTS